MTPSADAAILASSEHCAFCDDMCGESYVRHIFPCELLSAPLLMRPLCEPHRRDARAFVCSPRTYAILPQLPPESAAQQQQREQQTAAFAAILADPKSEGGKIAAAADAQFHAAVAERIPASDDDPLESNCLLCSQDPARSQVEYPPSELHHVGFAWLRLEHDAVGRAAVIPPHLRCPPGAHEPTAQHLCVHASQPAHFCGEHVWGLPRLFAHWNPWANEDGKGNISS